MAKSGEIKEEDWRLWMCDQESGKDFLHEWGPESEMRASMATHFSHDRDVWLVDPNGKKHLPK